MNSSCLLTFCILLLSFAIPIASAQKKTGDNRPLSGLDGSAIPTYKSVQSYIQAHPNSTLLSAAQVIGTAQEVPLARSTQSIRLQISQPGNSQLKIYRRPNGSIGWLEGAMTLPQQASVLGKQGATAAQRALALLTSQSALLRIVNPQEELVVMSSTRDELSYEHVRFQQLYSGIPVWGGDLTVHFNSQGVAYLINGTCEPSPVGVETIPTTSPADALESVVSDLRARKRYQPLAKEVASRLGIKDPSERLILYPMPEGKLRLAYEVTIVPNPVEWYSYIVDARDGQILNKIARHSTFFPRDESNRPLSSGTFNFSMPKVSSGLFNYFTNATAFDLNHTSRQIRVWWCGDSAKYYLIWDLPNLTWTTSLPGEQGGGGKTLTAAYGDFQGELIVSTDNTWTDAAAVSAHSNMKRVYDYYKDTHNRNALDNKGGCITSVVHVPDFLTRAATDETAWGAIGVMYGDGGVYCERLAGALDVAGHEMTHGVTESCRALSNGDPETKALNESFSDVFALMIDRTGRTDYLIGRTVMKATSGKVAIRDLASPRNPGVLFQAATNMSEFDAMQTEYYNAGIPSLAACSIIKNIGKEKAERIYYRALTTYLKPDSKFGDCRKSLQQAAEDLVGTFGIDYMDVNDVAWAFDSVGIMSPGLGGLRGFRGNEVPPVVGGKQRIAFMTSSGQIGLCDPVTGQTTMFTGPKAMARTTAGEHSQLSTGFNGQKIWFINQSGQLSYIDVVTGAVSSFPQVYVQQPGDLWNASVSPDETYVSLVSVYAGDSNLYIYDGKQVGKIPLKSTEGEINLQTIQCPGALSWSPNMKQPKIGFDAYHEILVGDSTRVGRWGIYEISFSGTQINNLVASQPPNVSLGNITYGNTDPDLIAFNYVDPAGKADVHVGSFDFGPVSALNLPSFSLGGTSIVDAEQPTFSPNDSMLCFTSTSRKSLLFYDRRSGQLSSLPFQMALYSPRWFVQGGKVASSAGTGQTPTTFGLFQNYPNPFNPTTRIEYEVPARTQVKLAVYDLLGRLVRTLVNAELQAGRFSTMWDGTDDSGMPLSSGMYVYRLETGDGLGKSNMLSRKMVFLK